MRLKQLVAIVALSCVLLAEAVFAKDRAECERVYRPTFGQAGKDVPWEPTSNAFAGIMLKLANTSAADHVYDLGAGDGAIVIAAAKQFGATAVGIEYNNNLAKLAQCYIEAEGLANKAKVVQGDIFKTDFSRATVVTMYLWPEVNIRLRPTLLKMTPGTRIVSHMHDMQNWKWDDSYENNGRRAYLWIVPAPVEGAWLFKEVNGGDTFSVTLKQKYQELTGKMRRARDSSDLKGSLRGAQVSIDLGPTGKLTGIVSGNQLNAVLTTAQGEKKYFGERSK